jgi:hypothetical protein
VRIRLIVLLAVVGSAIALAACGGSEKAYDIAPIFPLTEGKCAKYNGDEEGSGITASCMVSKDECERAAADWSEAMQGGGVNDAIAFTCD